MSGCVLFAKMRRSDSRGGCGGISDLYGIYLWYSLTNTPNYCAVQMLTFPQGAADNQEEDVFGDSDSVSFNTMWRIVIIIGNTRYHSIKISKPRGPVFGY